MADVVHLGPGSRPSRPLLRTVVGEVLRRRRQEQRRTLAEVARDANVSVQYLSEVERGRKEPSSEILAAVCDSLRFELADLLADVRLELTGQPAQVLRLHSHLATPAHFSTPAHRPAGPVLLAA